MSEATRSMGRINRIGLLTLIGKEIDRFLKVYHQTLLTPIVNALIFLGIFAFTLGPGHRIHSIDFLAYMGSGIVMMGMIQNAFANTSSMMVMGKVLGTLVDYLMPPFTSLEILFAITVGGVIRGAVVGSLIALVFSFFIDFPVFHMGYAIGYMLLSTTLLSLLGVLSGIFSDTFDQMSIMTNYVIAPLSFLSGTFYSITVLPVPLQIVCHYNPFYYLIDGFRYSLTGLHEASLLGGMAYCLGLCLALILLCHHLFRIGYRIKG